MLLRISIGATKGYRMDVEGASTLIITYLSFDVPSTFIRRSFDVCLMLFRGTWKEQFNWFNIFFVLISGCGSKICKICKNRRLMRFAKILSNTEKRSTTQLQRSCLSLKMEYAWKETVLFATKKWSHAKSCSPITWGKTLKLKSTENVSCPWKTLEKQWCVWRIFLLTT